MIIFTLGPEYTLVRLQDIVLVRIMLTNKYVRSRYYLFINFSMPLKNVLLCLDIGIPLFCIHLLKLISKFMSSILFKFLWFKKEDEMCINIMFNS